MAPYIIRNYQSADFSDYVRLRQEAEKLEPAGRFVSPQVITENLSRPNYSPEKDLFVVIEAGRIIGYLDMTPELGIGRIILEGWLHPEHRRKGLATQLLGYAMRRAGKLGARVVQVNIMENNAVAGKVLTRLGFKRVRRFFEFELDIARLSPQEADRAAQECCSLRRGEEAKLTQIQNRCFAGTWGYNPNTVAMIAYRTGLSHFSPEDVVLMCDGDRVIGYCWTELARGEDKREGRICMLGVDPDYRGRGVGRGVLLAGLAYLRSRGVGVAVLTVDSGNEVACALYRSVGFKIQASSMWYEKNVSQDTGAS